MDTGIKIECRKILKTLMIHKYGPVFNQPVDPIALGIPDYFSIITHPMDFGTISKKLDNDNYSSAEAFCSDVRLTFSNAMRYNPPGNYVHLMAKELNDTFGKSWKLLEAKSLKLSILKKNVVIPNKNHEPTKENSFSVSLKAKNPEATNTVTASSEVKPKPILSCAVKENRIGVSLKAKKPEATNIVTASSEVKLKPILSCVVKENRVGVSLKAKKPEATNIVTASSEVKPKPILSCAVKENSVGVSLKAKKPEATNIVTASSEVKPEPKPILSCAEKARLKNEFLLASRGDLSGPLRGFLRKYDLVSLKKEKIESVFGSFGDHTLIELKRVMKGCSGTNIVQGKDVYVKTPQTKEVSLRQKHEEMSNIESRIRAARAAKEAILQSAKSELQMKRDKEREEVEKMGRTVIIDDNLAVLMELEKLCQYSGIKNPLEKLGLRLKEEYYYGYEYVDDDDEVDNGVVFYELEDGEIL
ncbi:uncharacterized protein LOC143614520 [Bidens hawaiensis]|uniref:uncharacterized protein LOC143614520 n=1 Tax=Bidens hawaiensis TaxID=980011 RepID=UPI00404A009B